MGRTTDFPHYIVMPEVRGIVTRLPIGSICSEQPMKNYGTTDRGWQFNYALIYQCYALPPRT